MSQLLNSGVLLMLLVTLFQTSMSAIVKGVAPHITTGVEVLTYYVIPLIVLVVMICRSGWGTYKTDRFGFYFLRGALAAAAVFCFFYASRNTQLGVAAVLFNTTPVFVPLFAWLFLKEKVSTQVVFAIVISLIGVIIVIHPGLKQFFTPVSLIGLASGVLMALGQVMLRHLAKSKEPVNKIVFYLYFSSALFAAVVVLGESLFSGHSVVQIHTGGHAFLVIGFLLLLGIISLIAQRTLTKAFTFMPAGKLAPFLYVSIPTSSLVGWFVWQQRLDLSFFIGAVLILVGILMITFDKPKEQLCKPQPQQHLVRSKL